MPVTIPPASLGFVKRMAKATARRSDPNTSLQGLCLWRSGDEPDKAWILATDGKILAFAQLPVEHAGPGQDQDMDSGSWVLDPKALAPLLTGTRPVQLACPDPEHVQATPRSRGTVTLPVMTTRPYPPVWGAIRSYANGEPRYACGSDLTTGPRNPGTFAPGLLALGYDIVRPPAGPGAYWFIHAQQTVGPAAAWLIDGPRAVMVMASSLPKAGADGALVPRPLALFPRQG